MTDDLQTQIDQIKQSIAALEAQRGVLDEAVIEASVAALREKLAAVEGQARPQQQRKLATLLFVDTAGSTRFYQGLDPEEVRDIQDTALKRLSGPVDKYGGHVTRFMGDGFKAIFGVPLAQEDDPERAVRAGLEILATAVEIAQELESQRGLSGFDVRAGINTGLVAVGGLTEAGDTVMGAPVNLAARLESAAPPGGLLVSHDTYRHIAGLFDVEPLLPVTAKGFDEPVAVYLVKRVRPRTFYILNRGVEGVRTRMVGRQLELQMLQNALYNTLESGEGQAVTLVGEAGVGKSRLLSEFLSWVESRPESRMVFLGRSLQGRQSQPYALLRSLFSQHFDIQENDSTEVVSRKVEAGMAGYLDLREAHTAGQLLGFDFGHSPHLAGVLENPQLLRDEGLKALLQFFRKVASKLPVLVILEDIHWADDSSLDFIDLLGRSLQDRRVMIVNSARPEYFERRPYWGEGQDSHSRIRLEPLTKWDSRKLVEEILQRMADLPDVLRELVVSGAEGNPFYIEEMIKMLFEQGVIVKEDSSGDQEKTWKVEAIRLVQVRVPPTLTGVLQARLDSLPASERDVLQQASVVGRLFWDQAVDHIHHQVNPTGKETDVAALLASLRDRELIYHREASQVAGAQEYIIKHEVLRDVTYESVPLRTRREYHKLAAEWLLARSGARVSEHAEQAAEHYEQAGQIQEAIQCLRQAGDQAVARFANPDAIQYYQHGLELLESLPEGSERDGLELELCIGLGVPLVQNKGYGGPETRQVYQRAYELCQHLGRPPSPPILRGLAIAALTEGNPAQGFQYGQQILEQAKEWDDSFLYSEAYYVLGAMSFWQGKFSSSREYLEEALRYYDPQHQNLHLARFSQDPKAVCLVRLGITVWMLGYPEQALEKIEASVRFARSLGHHFSLVYVLAYVSWMYALLPDKGLLLGYADETLVLGSEHRIDLLYNMAKPFHSWASAENEPSEEIVRKYGQEIPTGLDFFDSVFIYYYANLLERRGQYQAGLVKVNAALEKAARQGCHYLEAELLCQKGVLLHRQGVEPDEVEACFQQALQVARAQSARSLELRAALSLGEFLREQGREGEARGLVESIYSTFTEGFDTPDLQKAAAFLG